MRHWRLWSVGAELGIYPLLPEERKSRGRRASPLRLLECLLLSPPSEAATNLLEQLRNDNAAQKMQKESGRNENNTIWDSNRTVAVIFEEYGQSFQRTFGSVNNQGAVCFLDALPLPGWKYEVDVMTPHYGEYYGKTHVPPADWLTPNPVTFLVISSGSRFR